jgi:hypothetical protein
MQLPQKIPIRQTIILAIAGLLIVFIAFKTLVNVNSFLSVLNNIVWPYFFLGLATMIPITILGILKWYFVLTAAGINVSFKKIFKIVISSISLTIIPGRLGDLARSYPLRNTVSISESISSIILEKIVDIAVLMIFSGLGLLFLGYVFYGTILLVLALLILPILNLLDKFSHVFLPKNNLTSKIHQAFTILQKVKKRKTMLMMAISSSVVNWVFTMVHIFWLFISVGAQVPFSAIFAFHPLSTFVGLLPVTLAGTGTRDSTMVFLFKNFATPEQSFSVGILYGIQTYWLLALLGIPLLYYFFKRVD